MATSSTTFAKNAQLQEKKVTGDFFRGSMRVWRASGGGFADEVPEEAGAWIAPTT